MNKYLSLQDLKKEYRQWLHVLSLGIPEDDLRKAIYSPKVFDEQISHKIILAYRHPDDRDLVTDNGRYTRCLIKLPNPFIEEILGGKWRDIDGTCGDGIPQLEVMSS